MRGTNASDETRRDQLSLNLNQVHQHQKLSPRNQVNFMEELQNQLKSGKSLLRKKSIDKMSVNHTFAPSHQAADTNNNNEAQANQMADSEALKRLSEQRSQEQLRRQSSNGAVVTVLTATSTAHHLQMAQASQNPNSNALPDWKLKLIEKKKQQQQQQMMCSN